MLAREGVQGPAADADMPVIRLVRTAARTISFASCVCVFIYKNVTSGSTTPSLSPCVITGCNKHLWGGFHIQGTLLDLPGGGKCSTCLCPSAAITGPGEGVVTEGRGGLPDGPTSHAQPGRQSGAEKEPGFAPVRTRLPSPAPLGLYPQDTSLHPHRPD